MILSFQTDRSWANSADPDQTAPIRVYNTVCHSVCIIWTHYSMAEPHSSNFRVITTNFWGVQIFRKFTVEEASDKEPHPWLHRVATSAPLQDLQQHETEVPFVMRRLLYQTPSIKSITQINIRTCVVFTWYCISTYFLSKSMVLQWEFSTINNEQDESWIQSAKFSLPCIWIVTFCLLRVQFSTLCAWRWHRLRNSLCQKWFQLSILRIYWKKADKRIIKESIWTASSEFGTYSLCEQRRFRRACASAQSRQNLRCSLI